MDELRGGKSRLTLTATLKERSALGRQRRKQMRRADHAGWSAHLRAASPLDLLKLAYRGRVPSLQSIKNQRMSLSPFSYFRGAVPVMAYDLSLTGNTGILTQLCGDAHVQNLGAFEGPGGELLFDLNDFDETISGPFEWDVKRMATSLILAGWDAGVKRSEAHAASQAFLESYRLSILRFARMPVLELARYQVHRIQDLATVSQLFAMAQRSTPTHNLLALTEPQAQPKNELEQPKDKKMAKSAGRSGKADAPDDAPRIFQSRPPLLKRLHGAAAQSVLDSLTLYAESLQPIRRHFLRQYRPIDVAFKVVGTGSVGLRDYCIYMEGNGPADPLFLQIKEETLSAYVPYLDARPVKHQGRRVVDGERAMQLQSDPFLGWTSIEGRDYLVRQLNDHKASIDITQLKAVGLLEYASVCGEILARGHARAGDPAVLAGYIGSSTRFDEAITRFARAYADQTEVDWKHFVRATRTSPNSKPRRKSVTQSKPKR